MKEILNVCIYCRVLDAQAKDLLDVQEEILISYADKRNMNVVEIIKEVSSGNSFKSNSFQRIICKIIHEEIDALLIFERTRITVFDDLYSEFELICYKHKVKLIEVKNLINDECL